MYPPGQIKIITESPVTIYIASGTPMGEYYWYPHRLQSVSAVSRQIRTHALSYILDSEIHSDDVRNQDLLDMADQINADYVIPVDYIAEQDKTTESVRDFLDLYAEHECRSQPLIPLQPPYKTHYNEWKGYSHYALGGLASAPADEQLDEIRRFREVAGDTPYAHALGMGVSSTVITALRDNPTLVDSIDCSTPELMTVNNRLSDKHLRQIPFEFPTGKHSTAIRASFAKSTLLMLNYLLGPYCTDDVVSGDQTGIADFREE